jgi:transposase|tara:strand:+ start:565 stop:957 length:393 start_codon:yes stop_codon:yes gene_type:complete
VDPKDEAKLVQAFLDDMKHGLHLAMMLEAYELVKRFKRIQKAADAVLDIAATASPGITLSNSTPKWKDAVGWFFKEWNGTLSGRFPPLMRDTHRSLQEHTRKLHKVLTPMGIRPGQPTNWLYGWAGRRKP